MIPIINKKVIIYVSSAIDIESFVKINYGPGNNYGPRTIFDRDKRLSQTLLTIKNLKYFFPSSEIIIFDAGEVYDKAIESINNTNCAKIYFLKNFNQDAYQFSKNCSNKGLCETILTLEFLKKFDNKITEHEYFIKFSGRYIINNFSVNEDFSNSFFTKRIFKFDYDTSITLGVLPEHIYNNNIISWASTLIYGFPITSIEEFKKGMNEIYNFYDINKSVDYEILFYYNIINRMTKELSIKELDILIEGRQATSGEAVFW